jgi:hypothetical protein
MLYEANDSYSATLTAGYTVGQSTLSVTAVPANLPTIITAGYNTDKETQFIVTGSSGGNTLTGVSRLKGANENLDNLTPLTCVNNQEFFNQFLTMISSAEALQGIIFAADGGSTDAYEVTMSPAVEALTTGLTIIVKFNTLNTGPATIDVNGLGVTDIKKYGNQALVTGDIIAGQVSILVFDGTNFQLMSVNVPALVFAAGSDINTGTDETKAVNSKTIADSYLGGATSNLQSQITALPTNDSVDTFTNKRVTKRIGTVADSATPTPAIDDVDIYTVTALAQAATFGSPTGTPTNGQTLIIRIKDNGTARALDFNAIYRFSTDIPKPTTTVLSKTLYMGFIYNTADSKWDCVASINNF